MNARPMNDMFENEIFCKGGFTYSPSFGFMNDTAQSREVFGRYCVAIENVHVLSGDISQRQIRDMVNHAANNPGLCIGAWKDTETGLTHWDYVKTYNDITYAKMVGFKFSEIAIYDSWEKVEIRL